jgi:hypothetical protein
MASRQIDKFSSLKGFSRACLRATVGYEGVAISLRASNITCMGCLPDMWAIPVIVMGATLWPDIEAVPTLNEDMNRRRVAAVADDVAADVKRLMTRNRASFLRRSMLL